MQCDLQAVMSFDVRDETSERPRPLSSSSVDATTSPQPPPPAPATADRRRYYQRHSHPNVNQCGHLLSRPHHHHHIHRQLHQPRPPGGSASDTTETHAGDSDVTPLTSPSAAVVDNGVTGSSSELPTTDGDSRRQRRSPFEPDDRRHLDADESGRFKYGSLPCLPSAAVDRTLPVVDGATGPPGGSEGVQRRRSSTTDLSSCATDADRRTLPVTLTGLQLQQQPRAVLDSRKTRTDVEDDDNDDDTGVSRRVPPLTRSRSRSVELVASRTTTATTADPADSRCQRVPRTFSSSVLTSSPDSTTWTTTVADVELTSTLPISS